LHGLTPTEADVIATALRSSASRRDQASTRGVSPNTLKTLIRRALAKLGAKTLAEVRQRAIKSLAAAGGPVAITRQSA
jgi:DNA-binding CsgD family transcriptional regulator